MKKFLALLMCTLMLCSLAPLSAFADPVGHALNVEDADFTINNSLVNQWPSGSLVTDVEPVVVTAYANTADREFDSWEVTPAVASITADALRTSPLSFTMPGNELTVKAKYKYKLTVTDGANGTGAGTPGLYLQGESVTITAGTPAAGYKFASWDGMTGVAFAANNSASVSPATFTMPKNTLSAVANYTQVISDVSVAPTSATVSAGSTGTVLTATATTTDASVPTLNWYKCSAAGVKEGSSLGTAATLAIPTTADSAADTYYYLCEASKPGVAPISSGPVAVTVYQPGLTVTDVAYGSVVQGSAAQTQTIGVTNNSAATLNVTAALDTANAGNFILTKTGGNVAPGSDTSWTIRPTDAVMAAGAATYHATVTFSYTQPETNQTATAVSDITLTITDRPSITINNGPQSATILTGSSVNLTTTATVSGGGTPTYTWYRCSNIGGTVAEQVGTNSSTYTFSSQTANTYYFKCVVSYPNADSKTTDVAAVTVSGTADVGISIPSISANVGYTAASVLKDITISNTGTTAVTINSVAVNGSNFTVTGGNNGMSLGVGNNNTSWKIQPNTGLSAGTYSATVTVTYNTTRTLSASVVFTVSAPVSVTPEGLSFPALYEGYTAPGSLNFTVTNNTGAAVVLDVVSNLGANTRFNFASRCSAGSGRSSYAVSPKTGLRASTAPYTETLTFYNGSIVVKTVTVSVTVQSSVNYAFTKGMGQYWYMGSSKLMTFECNGSYSKFLGITIDGKYVFTRDGDELYDGAGDLVGWCAEGSTIVTFSRYLQNSFGAGRYNLRFNYTDGYVDTYFRVYNRTGSPPTGDTSNMALWVGLLACSAVAAIVVVPKLIKRKGKTE